MFTSYPIILIFLITYFDYGESVKCQRCSSTDYDSPCRKGTDETQYECPADEQSCYAEYFHGGDEPLYRRGCSPSDWCKQQEKNHGSDFKYCKTCEGENCNTDIIGGPDSSQLQCFSCYSEELYGTCNKGGIRNDMQLCKKDESCFYFHVVTSQKNSWKRGCGGDDYCSKQEKEYKGSLATCKLCDDDLCNNIPMDVSPI